MLRQGQFEREKQAGDKVQFGLVKSCQFIAQVAFLEDSCPNVD